MVSFVYLYGFGVSVMLPLHNVPSGVLSSMVWKGPASTEMALLTQWVSSAANASAHGFSL